MTRRANRLQYRLAALVSHPIQYQVPLFRMLAARPEIDFRVFFCCRWGAERYQDPGFGISLAWDVPLLTGYQYTFLSNLSLRPGPSHFWGTVNPGVIAAMMRGNFDAIWIHGWALATNWMAWAGAVVQHVPVLLRGETNGLIESIGLKGVMRRIALTRLFSRTAGFLAIGTYNANFYRSYGVPDERIFWTPYAVDNDFFMQHAHNLADEKRLLREKAGIPPDLPAILFCGKFLEAKRPFDLLKAFALLNGHPEASLLFVGDGPLRSAMQRFTTEQRLAHVHFLGFRNQTELPSCYAMADLLVLPSSSEPWGLVLNEAMCFGLPVIASDQVGAAADLVRQGVNGFTYAVGDVPALADCLRKILLDEGVRQRMGRHSHTLIMNWGFKEDVEGVLKALRAVAGESI